LAVAEKSWPHRIALPVLQLGSVSIPDDLGIQEIPRVSSFQSGHDLVWIDLMSGACTRLTLSPSILRRRDNPRACANGVEPGAAEA
jgi:hypothetical protein